MRSVMRAAAVAVDVVRRAASRVRLVPRRVAVEGVAARGQVGAGAERAAGAGDDDGAHRVVARRSRRTAASSSLAHRRVVGVELVGPVERDRGDAVVDVVARGLERRQGHVSVSSMRLRCHCFAGRRATLAWLSTERPACEPRPAACVQPLDLGADELGHVELDVVADALLDVREVPVALRQRGSRSGRARAAPLGRPDRCGPSRRSAGAARGPSGRRDARRSRRSGRCRRHRTARPRPGRAARSSSSSARSARSPATSIALPPRKCRMLTPFAQPSS